MLGMGLCSRIRLGKAVISLEVLLLIACGLCGHAYGDEDTTSALLPRSSWEIGFEYDHFAYEERQSGNELMEEQGSLTGLSLAWTGHQPTGLMLRFATAFVGGVMEYDGQTQAGDPVKEDTDDLILRLRGLIGLDSQWGNFALTPYTGIAYRYWNDHVRGSGGYEREVHYLYTPFGIETAMLVADEWTWGLRAEYDAFWLGAVKSHLSDVDSALNDPTVEQDEGYGVRGSVYLKRRLADLSLGLELFVQYWDIDRSDTDTLEYRGMPVGIVWEPKNETLVSGFLLSLLF